LGRRDYILDEDIVNKKISATKIRLLLEYGLLEVVGDKLSPEGVVSKIMSMKVSKRFEDHEYKIKIMKKRGTYNPRKSMIILHERLASKNIKPKSIIDFYRLWLSCFGVALWGEELSETQYFMKLKEEYNPEELGKVWEKLFERMAKFEKSKYNTYGGIKFEKFYTRFKKYFRQLEKRDWLI